MRQLHKACVNAVAATALLVTSSSVPAAVDCVGLVTSLSLDLNASGTVTLSLAGGPSYTYLCNIDGTALNGVSPAVCRTMYASLLLAKTTGKRVSIRFYDHDSCVAVTPWANSGTLGWTIMALD
jgi:hypothetical protein